MQRRGPAHALAEHASPRPSGASIPDTDCRPATSQQHDRVAQPAADPVTTTTESLPKFRM